MEQTQNKQSSDGAIKFILIFGLGWVVFALIFIMLGILIVRGETYMYNQMIEEGQTTNRAIITNLNIYNDDESTSYYVAYKFDALVNGDPTSFSNGEGVTKAFYDTLHLDQRIEVIYVASDPTTARIKSQLTPPNTAIGWLFGGLGTLFLLVGLFVGFIGLRSRKKAD